MKKYIILIFILLTIFTLFYVRSRVIMDVGVIEVNKEIPIKFIFKNSFNYETDSKFKFLYLFENGIRRIQIDSTGKLYAYKSWKNFFKQPLIQGDKFHFVVKDSFYLNNKIKPFYYYERRTIKVKNKNIEYLIVVIDTIPVIVNTAFKSSVDSMEFYYKTNKF